MIADHFLVFFILKGSVVMHIDLNDPLINPDYKPKERNEDDNDEDDAYNVPFNLYVEGSYFGDSDCLYQKKQVVRECMAEAEQECHLLVIKKSNLEDLLDQFPKIKSQMFNIAQEKRKYHKRLIQELLRKQKLTMNHELVSPLINGKKIEPGVDIMKYKSLVRI